MLVQKTRFAGLLEGENRVIVRML